MQSSTLGYEIQGHGPRPVIVLHDWFCDRSNWEPVRPYLSSNDMTYAFVDLRGYGTSRNIKGAYTLEEASADVLALVRQLGWKRFSVVGHSMSSLVMQRLAQLAPDRMAAGVAITPVPPTGLGKDEEMIAMSKKLAMASDERRGEILPQIWGTRLSDAWIAFKARRWGEVAERAAVAAYVDMYCKTDISEKARGVQTPMLIVAAEQDASPFRAESLAQTMLPYYPNAEIATLHECGHYPMQEMPPLLATLLERFLTRHA